MPFGKDACINERKEIVKSDLYSFAKLLTFDLDKCSCYGLHIRLGIAKSDPATPDWVSVLVRVYACIHHTWRERWQSFPKTDYPYLQTGHQI